jgi:hypothetical protein
MALQVRLVQIFGLVAIIAGIIVNILKTGILSSITFAAIMTIIIYLAVVQVGCLLTGRCNLSSWFAAITFLIAFAGVTYFYLSALINGEPLPGLEQQPIAKINPVVHKSISLANKYTGINAYNLRYTKDRALS